MGMDLGLFRNIMVVNNSALDSVEINHNLRPKQLEVREYGAVKFRAG